MWILNLKMLNKKGFTLMEMIVVTAIISILFTISYTTYKGYHQRARAYSAKKDLSSIVAMAEVFRANTGFYLPNLRAMHIPIKGRYSHNYKVICRGTGGNVLWETNAIETDTCGGFQIEKTTSTPPELHSVGSCTHSSTNCWMGAVLCNHYDNSVPLATILCGSEDYTLKSEDRGVMQWKPANDDWTNDSDVKKKELAPLFNIVDFAAKKDDGADPPSTLTGDPHCKRVSRQDDVFAESSDCFFNKEFAVNSSDIPAIFILVNWTGDEESFISTPSKLVVTALACKEKQDDCVGTSFDYSVIRMDTNRLVKIVQ